MESVITQLETMMNKRISEKSRGYLALVGTVFCLALGPLIVKSSEAPGVVSSFYRMSIAAIAITPFFCLSLKREKSIQSGRTKIPQFAILLPIFAGISSAIDHSLWGTAVKMTNLNNAMVLRCWEEDGSILELAGLKTLLDKHSCLPPADQLACVAEALVRPGVRLRDDLTLLVIG